MKKKTKEELVHEWAKKHNIFSDNPWFDKNNDYYNLTVKQIVALANYINRNYNNAKSVEDYKF